MSETETIRVDLYWKDHDFGLEYQGKYGHSEGTDIARDITRQLAAGLMGKTLQMITVRQLREKEQRFLIAEIIARHIGEKVLRGHSFEMRNQRLIDSLLGPT